MKKLALIILAASLLGTAGIASAHGMAAAIAATRTTAIGIANDTMMMTVIIVAGTTAETGTSTVTDAVVRGASPYRTASANHIAGIKGRLNAMSRYKGRTSFKEIERHFPHIVEIAVPDGGLGKKLDAMYDWYRARGIQAMHGRGHRDENGRDYIRWCFDDSVVAAQFVSEFGGAVGKLD
jgi:hypothetical protein